MVHNLEFGEREGNDWCIPCAMKKVKHTVANDRYSQLISFLINVWTVEKETRVFSMKIVIDGIFLCDKALNEDKFDSSVVFEFHFPMQDKR